MKLADFVSGLDGMKKIVILCGCPNVSVTTPMLIFQNDARNYLIRGIPDNVAGVCYRAQTKGQIDGLDLLKWVKETRKFAKITDGRKRVIFLDNCSGHMLTAELNDEN